MEGRKNRKKERETKRKRRIKAKQSRRIRMGNRARLVFAFILNEISCAMGIIKRKG
jgi:hypothetical protein